MSIDPVGIVNLQSTLTCQNYSNGYYLKYDDKVHRTRSHVRIFPIAFVFQHFNKVHRARALERNVQMHSILKHVDKIPGHAHMRNAPMGIILKHVGVHNRADSCNFFNTLYFSPS